MLAGRLRQLVGQSAVYGLGGLVSRLLAVLLLPLYTAYLDPDDLGKVGVLIAFNAVLVTILRGGVSSAFFRFWFDSPEPEKWRTVLRTSFWFTMAMATLGLVRAQFIALWAQMNYEQLTAVFRVEQRASRFLAASLANVAITIAATVVLVVGFDNGALGVIVGNFTGTLAVYLALLGYRREQLGLELDRPLLHAM